MAREQTETTVRDLLLSLLAARFGEGDVRRAGRAPEFSIKESFGGGTCSAEGILEYALPNGKRLSHRNDLLLTRPNNTYVAIELKFLSAVTDQFKARTYDMLHLKRTFGDRLLGLMVYVHVPGNGLSLPQAKAICYPFDHFIGMEVRIEEREKLKTDSLWSPVIELLAQKLQLAPTSFNPAPAA